MLMKSKTMHSLIIIILSRASLTMRPTQSPHERDVMRVVDGTKSSSSFIVSSPGTKVNETISSGITLLSVL